MQPSKAHVIEEQPFFSCFAFCVQPERHDRHFQIFQKKVPKRYLAQNIVRTQLYSVITFIPFVLFNQFKYFYNFFFLAIAVTQFFPPLKVGKTLLMPHPDPV